MTVTSKDGTETKSYEMTVTRGGDGSTVTADVRLKTLTVTPVDGTGTLLSFSPSFHLDTEAQTFKVRVSSDTDAVRVSVEKNSPSPDVRLMRTETRRLDSLDEDPDLAGIQFELTMDRFDLGGARENRYKSIWVIGSNAKGLGCSSDSRVPERLALVRLCAIDADAILETIRTDFPEPPSGDLRAASGGCRSASGWKPRGARARTTSPGRRTESRPGCRCAGRERIGVGVEDDAVAWEYPRCNLEYRSAWNGGDSAIVAGVDEISGLTPDNNSCRAPTQEVGDGLSRA